MTEMTLARRDVILRKTRHILDMFLYYDRKEDDELPVDAIQEAVKQGEITIEEIVEAFETELRKSLK
jgi:hypothetical protein